MTNHELDADITSKARNILSNLDNQRQFTLSLSDMAKELEECLGTPEPTQLQALAGLIGGGASQTMAIADQINSLVHDLQELLIKKVVEND
ncbi:hypothetical protein CYK25_008985 [Varibaculum cambriense]|nr:hypothetical protein CYK25_008985 [Varibaculum cambriense]